MTCLTLWVKFASLQSLSTFVNRRFPSRSADETNRARSVVVKDLLDLFQRLLTGLGEEEECMDEHASTEYAEDDVHLPLDVGEGWGHEICESKVESPVC